MRLLNVKTRKFEEFLGDNVPSYAILSHRWVDSEVTFQDINSGRLSAWRKTWSKSWPPKLEGCRLQAITDNLSYIWIDTCCIDKTNSVELAEAINSMFNWYKNAARCYAYLSDVPQPSSTPSSSTPPAFRHSKWFTRGWTLQELLAPKEVYFYGSRWHLIGTKTELWADIEAITRIPRAFLVGWADLHEASVAQRMSWAANRVTTRKEDVAYCLLGLFGITMPMIYGEKEQAFVRLQLEIMRHSGDQSILAWGLPPCPNTTDEDTSAIHSSVLATLPADFANSRDIVPCVGYKQQITTSFEFLGGLLRMQVPVVNNNLPGQLFGLLNCGPENDKAKLAGIPLTVAPADEQTDNYLRPAGRQSILFPISQMQDYNPKLICIRRDASGLQSKSAIRRNCFYIDESATRVKLVDVLPKDRWIEDKKMITTSNGSDQDTQEETFLRFRRTNSDDDDFVVVLVFKSENGLVQGTGHLMILSQDIPLTDLVKDFTSISTYLYGKQSGSNGGSCVSVSVRQEPVAGQHVFVVKLIALAKSSDIEKKTADATEYLTMLRLEREQERDRANREALQLKLINSVSLLDEAESKERKAQFSLNEVQVQLQIAKEQAEKAEEALKVAQSGAIFARNQTLALEHELRELQIQDDSRKRTIQRLKRRGLRSQNEARQLVIGIDFGTTSTGVAFASVTDTEVIEDVITKWPGSGSGMLKLPTTIYYDEHQRVAGWGCDFADALQPTGHHKLGIYKVECFRLLLASGNTYIDSSIIPSLPPGKSEVEVTADYLFRVHQTVRNYLQEVLGQVFNREEHNILYVLTVPAIWNDAAMTRIHAAAIQAGFLRDENDNKLILVIEPVAAIRSCLKTNFLNLKADDVVLVVDCGGRTVNLIAYKLREVAPFSISECTAASGDSCGSIMLNRSFCDIVQSKIRKTKIPDGSATALKIYAKCVMDFENRIKRGFRNNGMKWAIDIGIAKDYPELSIEDGYMIFTNEEVLSCYEPIVNRILELVRNQIIQIGGLNQKLQNILIVGGFSASEYLFQQIRLNVPQQFAANVVRPMEPEAVFMKGAVSTGITKQR